jgi:hypothetical protein
VDFFLDFKWPAAPQGDAWIPEKSEKSVFL